MLLGEELRLLTGQSRKIKDIHNLHKYLVSVAMEGKSSVKISHSYLIMQYPHLMREDIFEDFMKSNNISLVKKVEGSPAEFIYELSW